MIRFIMIMIIFKLVHFIVMKVKNDFSCYKLHFSKDFVVNKPTLILLNHTDGFINNDFLLVLLLAKYLYKKTQIKSAVVTGVENLGFGSLKCIFRFSPEYLHIIYGKNRTQKSIDYLKNKHRHVIMFAVSSKPLKHNNPNLKTGPFHIVQKTNIPVQILGVKFKPKYHKIQIKALRSPIIDEYSEPKLYKSAIIDVFTKHTKVNYKNLQ